MRLRPHEALHFREFTKGRELETLLGWARSLFQAGLLRPNGASPNRFFEKHDRLKDVPGVFYDIRDRLVSKLRIAKWIEEPMYSCFVGCNLKGAAIHPHVDPTPHGQFHVRCNLILSK